MHRPPWPARCGLCCCKQLFLPSDDSLLLHLLPAAAALLDSFPLPRHSAHPRLPSRPGRRPGCAPFLSIQHCPKRYLCTYIVTRCVSHHSSKLGLTTMTSGIARVRHRQRQRARQRMCPSCGLGATGVFHCSVSSQLCTCGRFQSSVHQRPACRSPSQPLAPFGRSRSGVQQFRIVV